MDPRTFLKPRHRPACASPPVIGESRTPPQWDPGRTTLLVFLRHVGCPFAEKTMRDLTEFAANNPDVHCIAVSHGAPDQTAAWCDLVGAGENLIVVDDPDRDVYAEWGLGLTRLNHWLGRGSLSGVAALASEGIRNRHPSGTRWQSAGAFALSAEGAVVWRHIPKHAGDLPDFEDAKQNLRV